MLKDTLFTVPRKTGLQLLHRRGEGDARELTSWRLRVPAGGVERYAAPGEETIVVLQEGRGTFESGSDRWSVSRASVFTERATALLLPPGHPLTVRAETPIEAILISAPAPDGGTPVLVRGDDVQAMTRGRDTFTRDVHNVFVTDGHAKRLLVGETFNPPGNWSSYPPHKHDGRDGEPVLEEVYHYRVDPPQGFGVQMLYTSDGESITHTVHDGDAVLLPYGYHPVSAPPGYRLYYLWGMAGAERRLALHEDPTHSWINKSRTEN
jgi:5-deoxy-glucuronate isomerase